MLASSKNAAPESGSKTGNRPNSANEPKKEVVLPRVPSAATVDTHSIGSFNSLSRREMSSKASISISIDSHAVSKPNDKEGKKRACIAVCFHKLFGNYILPGVFGIYRCRYVEKLNHTHLISRELLSNVNYYSSKLRSFFSYDLLPEMKLLSTMLYFPTGQIEADGLSAISGEIWAATYLLLGIHKEIREADFYSIRSAYATLVWDSSQTYRQTVKFFKTLQAFKEEILPIWKEVEDIVGLKGISEYIEQDNALKTPCKRGKSNKTEVKRHLSKVKVREGYPLENGLSLQVVQHDQNETQKKSLEMRFHEMDYGRQIEIIKEILKNPVEPLQAGSTVFKRTERRLTERLIAPLKEGAVPADFKDEELVNADLTCAKAMKILHATMNILFEEVKMTETMRFDVIDSVKALSDDIEAYLEYADWVCNKFSEFHSMLRLCYNFALLCFDLDLPSFDSVITKEMNSGTVGQQPETPSSTKNNNTTLSESSLSVDDQLEYKVVSLTHLMMEASTTFVSPGRQPVIDDDFDWQDFYKTDYHDILQRLPIRAGYDLLQFSANPNVTIVIRQRGNLIVSDQAGVQTGVSRQIQQLL